MIVLVTGANGQLGRAFQKIAPQFEATTFIFATHHELDITHPEAVSTFFKTTPGISCIINCAAYTHVDRAEREREKAFRVNRDGANGLAGFAKRWNIRLVHLSTDFVFDGKANQPYQEGDSTNPLSVYAQSKLAGESAVLDSGCDALVVRTSWLYSEYSHNFLKTMVHLGKERNKIGVVYDQVGTPTYASDLAKAVMLWVTSEKAGPELFHYSNEGAISRYDFASAIMRCAKLPCKVHAIETKDLPLPAVRPKYSVLNKTKIKKAFNIEIPNWFESMKVCIEELKRGES